MISLTLSLFRCWLEAACITRAISDPEAVPAIAITFSPETRRPASVAMSTISKQTFTPWQKHRRRLAIVVALFEPNLPDQIGA